MHATAALVDRRGLVSVGPAGVVRGPGSRTPGGAFIDGGIDAIDELRWLAGSEVEQVEAKMANLVHGDIEVEDWGQATFTFANGDRGDSGGGLDRHVASENRPLAEAERHRAPRESSAPEAK